MIASLFRFAATHGRIVLIAGLVAGISLPAFALTMKDYLAPLIATLLFLNAFRIGPRAAFGSFEAIRSSLMHITVLQLLLPCIVVALLAVWQIEHPLALAVVLVAAASSITGSPNLTQLLGYDPSASLRLLVLGTALLPLTVLPVFFLSPALNSPELVTQTAFRLSLVIGASALLAFSIRHLFFRSMNRQQEQVVDGLSVTVMAFVVIGLMSAMGPALLNRPTEVAFVLALAFLINYGLQAACFYFLPSSTPERDTVAISVVCGNRNLALFLTALPAAITDPLLLFIACYQLPMYLTPILMVPVYKSGKRPVT